MDDCFKILIPLINYELTTKKTNNLGEDGYVYNPLYNPQLRNTLIILGGRLVFWSNLIPAIKDRTRRTTATVEVENNIIKSYDIKKRNLDIDEYLYQYISHINNNQSWLQKKQSSNNVNLLKPIGQLEKEMMAVKIPLKARYNCTKLSPFTTLIYRPDDDILINYLNKDDQKIRTKMVCSYHFNGLGWLREKKPYTKKPLYVRLHNHCIISDILKEERSQITDDTPVFFAELTKRHWGSNPKNRPAAKKIWKYFGQYCIDPPEKKNKLAEAK
nr:2450_t:CDS:2 [Entrophospora candida]